MEEKAILEELYDRSMDKIFATSANYAFTVPNGEYKISKPDTDNLQKLLKDCMTVCEFWKDDALVASEIVEKFWADIPGIYIRIEEL